MTANDRLAEVHRVVGIVARRLGPLREEVVFLGGATTALLVTDPGAPKPRPTKDVDVIVEIGGYAAYARLGEQLRELGFREDTSEGAPRCRYVIEGVKVDVMPTVEGPWGPSNRWYRAAMRTAADYGLPDGARIRLVRAPLFIATKLEAWTGRGKGDLVASHDLEDIVAVVDGRSSIVEECRSVDDDVRDSLGEELGSLLDAPGFESALAGHLPGDAAAQARVPLVHHRLARIAGRASAVDAAVLAYARPADVRAHLVDAMHADFTGPFAPGPKGTEEVLPLPTPTHPGEVLREEFLRPLGIAQTVLAARLGIPLQRVNEIVKEKRGISADTAWLLAQAFRTTPEFWMNLQTTYDLARQRPTRAIRPLLRKSA